MRSDITLGTYQESSPVPLGHTDERDEGLLVRMWLKAALDLNDETRL
jgi:hypothetical protein